MKRKLATLVFFLSLLSLAAADLHLVTEDFKISQTLEGGYFLWVRKKADIGSILLTESSADPAKRAHSYTLRNPDYNSLTGDERRILDGEFLESKDLYFLMDSTPEPHPELGEAFRIFIPYVVTYGYAWSRMGEIQVLDGTFLNIRTFERPYADYRGEYTDNPFKLQVRQRLLAEPEGRFMEETVDSFGSIAARGGGKALRSSGEEDLIEKIGDFIDGVDGKSLDLVLCLDTTKSMYNDMPALKERIVPLIAEHTGRFEGFRVGLLYYRDYMEAYLVKSFPFEDSLEAIQSHIDRVRVLGGRDIPEAVFEALYSGIHSYDWQAEERLIVLIGDAPPHPRPRGKVTAEMVYHDAEELGIEINTIILPQ